MVFIPHPDKKTAAAITLINPINRLDKRAGIKPSAGVETRPSGSAAQRKLQTISQKAPLGNTASCRFNLPAFTGRIGVMQLQGVPDA
jgi:hypothetical protein